MELKRLFRRTLETLKEGGIKTLFLKAKFYLRTVRNGKQNTAEDALRIFADVLFINGCYLPHPARYRVTHQREQLTANGMSNSEVFYKDLTIEYLKRYRVFIFYRCPYTEEIGEFIKAAKSFHKPVIYDIDDLVIDTKYTENIPYLSTMNADEHKDYDDGVNRMQKVLRMCDAAITTTEALAEELQHYVPEVFINRNTMSEAMCMYSKKAVYCRDELPEKEESQIVSGRERRLRNKILAKKKAEGDRVKIGYFSGSITHNDDIQLILPVLQRLMEQYSNVHFYFAGKLNIPKELSRFADRVHACPMVKWENLPERIASVDINIAPLADSIFNAAKSENKWTEAGLVKVPTVASNLGAMKQMIRNGETGILCSNDDEWFDAMALLITNPAERKRIGENAYNEVTAHCLTIHTGLPLCNFLRSKMVENVVFVLPSLEISGGIQVILKHCTFLKKAGYDVLIVNDNVGEGNVFKDGEELNVLSTRTNRFLGCMDFAVGSLWSTMYWILGNSNVRRKAYLVQGYETDFYEFGHPFRLSANRTYHFDGVEYYTVSKWCEKWLKETYQKDSVFLPDGLEREMFPEEKRNFSGRKIRILVEGNCDDYYKNVDESFRITNRLDPEQYEVVFLSSVGTPKKWYRVDQFLHRVPYEQVAQIYRECDILIKSSILESFSYPPLEMMATGGYVVVRPNDGNVEYLKNGENCLFYDPENLDTAVAAIQRIKEDPDLRETLYRNGLQTADSRSWKEFECQIVDDYMKR